MNGLADVDGFIICIQVCVWLGFSTLLLSALMQELGKESSYEQIQQAGDISKLLCDFVTFHPVHFFVRSYRDRQKVNTSHKRLKPLYSCNNAVKIMSY